MQTLGKILIVCFVISSFPVYSASGGGGGGGGYSSSSSSRSASTKSPENKAKKLYKKGLKYRDKARALEEKAAAAGSEKKAEKLIKKAMKEYDRAREKYEAAIDIKEDYFQALSSLGYVLRKTGEVDASLAAYNKSVGINPVYPEAIEYRAETYLQLGELDKVKEAYMELFADYPREYSDLLMKAMLKWKEDNTGNDSPEFAGFSQWISERKEVAENTARLDEPLPDFWENNS